MTLRQLNLRCGALMDATSSHIQALPVHSFEAMANTLLDFQGLAELAAWLASHT